MKPLFDYSAFITAELPNLNTFMGDMLEMDITFDGTSLTISSIHSEMDILTKFHHFHAEYDIDILAYKMDMTMINDEDDNWITTVTLTIINADN
jgi:hypothetical protein